MISEANENFLIKDLILFDSKKTNEKQAGTLLYSHVVVEWLREWSVSDQNEILVSGWLLFKGKVILFLKKKKIFQTLFDIIYFWKRL